MRFLLGERDYHVETNQARNVMFQHWYLFWLGVALLEKRCGKAERYPLVSEKQPAGFYDGGFGYFRGRGWPFVPLWYWKSQITLPVTSFFPEAQLFSVVLLNCLHGCLFSETNHCFSRPRPTGTSKQTESPLLFYTKLLIYTITRHSFL